MGKLKTCETSSLSAWMNGEPVPSICGGILPMLVCHAGHHRADAVWRVTGSLMLCRARVAVRGVPVASTVRSRTQV